MPKPTKGTVVPNPFQPVMIDTVDREALFGGLISAGHTVEYARVQADTLPSTDGALQMLARHRLQAMAAARSVVDGVSAAGKVDPTQWAREVIERVDGWGFFNQAEFEGALFTGDLVAKAVMAAHDKAMHEAAALAMNHETFDRDVAISAAQARTAIDISTAIYARIASPICPLHAYGDPDCPRCGWERVDTSGYAEAMDPIEAATAASAEAFLRCYEHEIRDPDCPICASETDPSLVNSCRASLDGECGWSGCPQLRDGEPKATGRHCPLDIGCARCRRADDDCRC